MGDFKEFNTDPWLKEWKEDVKEKKFEKMDDILKKEADKMKKVDDYKNKVVNWIEDHPEVTICVAAGIGIGIAAKLGKYIGYKKGFEAGIEAGKFFGETDMQWICPEKNVVKCIVKGMSGIGERAITMTTDAAHAEETLKDLQACVTAAKTGADPDMVYDLMNLINTLPTETVAKLAGIKEAV
jgi:hypothetical protein